MEIDILDEEYPILFQGELFKLKPGIKFEYCSRWVQITNQAIRYYKSRWTQNSNLQMPLGAVPLKAIKYIHILEPEKKKDAISANQSYNYRFELVLKDSFLPFYLDPYYDVSISEDRHKLIITTERKK